jgi:hypothetical protein
MTMLQLTSRHLTLVRIGLSLAGFAAALLAVTLEERRLTWAAIALLVGSLILRLIQRRQKRD